MRTRSVSTPAQPRLRTTVVMLVVMAMCLVLTAFVPNTQAGARDAAASAFAVRTVRLLVANRYSVAWASLHPSHQQAVGGRGKYVQCELSEPIVGSAMAIEGLEVRDEVALIAGIGRVRTKAVNVRITFAGAHGADGARVTLGVHVLLLDGSWRWVLPSSRYANYRRGGCG